jgi:hypothetical protein
METLFQSASSLRKTLSHQTRTAEYPLASQILDTLDVPNLDPLVI